MSDHGSELHSILVKAKALAITPSDRISLLRSHNVGATSDALLGLLNGAALCLLEITDEGLAGLADWLIGERVTVFTCVASVFRQRCAEPRPQRRLPSVLAWFISAAAYVFKSDIELFKRHCTDSSRLVNRLGIGEVQTAQLFFLSTRLCRIVEEPVVPVGFALDGYEIAVLDEAGKPVAPNTVGEIAVKDFSPAAIGVVQSDPSQVLNRSRRQRRAHVSFRRPRLGCGPDGSGSCRQK